MLRCQIMPMDWVSGMLRRGTHGFINIKNFNAQRISVPNRPIHQNQQDYEDSNMELNWSDQIGRRTRKALSEV